MCRFVQRNKFFNGDTVELVSPGKTGRSFKIEELTDAEGNPLESAPHPGMVFYARVPFDVSKFDIIRAGD